MGSLAFSLIPAGIDSTWQFILLGSLAAGLFSLAKSGFGGSIGLLSTPLMIFACGDSTSLATAIMLPMLIAADYVAVASWWRRWNFRALTGLIPSAVVGVALGAALLYFFRSFNGEQGRKLADAWLKLGVGVIALAFVGLQLVRTLLGRDLAFRPVAWQSATAGVTAGVTSTLAHAAGPVAAMYLLPQQMDKSRYVATTALFFWILNQVKLVPYIAMDMINLQTLGAGLLMLPAIAAGAALGVFLHRKVGARQFTGIIYALLALAGVEMVRKAAGVLWLQSAAG